MVFVGSPVCVAGMQKRYKGRCCAQGEQQQKIRIR